MRWEYDPEHGGLLYISLAHGKVDGTIRLDDDTLVDVAADGRVLGIEVLNGEERLPYLKHYPRGTIDAEPDPLFDFSIARNDLKERQRLGALVDHILTTLRALTVPVA